AQRRDGLGYLRFGCEWTRRFTRVGCGLNGTIVRQSLVDHPHVDLLVTTAMQRPVARERRKSAWVDTANCVPTDFPGGSVCPGVRRLHAMRRGESRQQVRIPVPLLG